MDLRAVLPAQNVLLDMTGECRNKILCRLAQPLVDANVLSDVNSFISDVEQREGQITTLISPMVAVPHARSNAVRRLGVSVGISRCGLPFASDGSADCRLLFLIAVPAFAPTAHLPLLQHFASFSHDNDRVKRILACNSPAKAANQLIRFSAPRRAGPHGFSS